MIRRIAGSNSVFAALVGAEGLEPEMGLKRRGGSAAKIRCMWCP